MSSAIGPKLPLTTASDRLYNEIDDVVDEVKQNFKILLLTNPGEKVFDRKFGIGIRRLLFQNFNTLNFSIETNIKEQAKRYIPSLTIQTIEIKEDKDNNALYLKIGFGIDYVPGNYDLGLKI